jgi:hypothetical protein
MHYEALRAEYKLQRSMRWVYYLIGFDIFLLAVLMYLSVR